MSFISDLYKIHLDFKKAKFSINFYSAPGVADLAAAGNWAEEYLAAEAVAQSQGDWSQEFMETRAPSRAQLSNNHDSSQWAHEYLEQNEHRVW